VDIVLAVSRENEIRRTLVCVSTPRRRLPIVTALFYVDFVSWWYDHSGLLILMSKAFHCDGCDSWKPRSRSTTTVIGVRSTTAAGADAIDNKSKFWNGPMEDVCYCISSAVSVVQLMQSV